MGVAGAAGFGFIIPANIERFFEGAGDAGAVPVI
jgi:hypothetical protein